MVLVGIIAPAKGTRGGLEVGNDLDIFILANCE